MRVGTAGLVAAAGLGVVAAFAPHTAAQAPARSAAGQVTFTKDVAPILQRSCQNCHRPGSIAPMSLLTYEDARPWARSIKQKVDGARDAAVARRSHRRHPQVQGRSVADRQGDRDDRRRGSTAARRAGNPADMPPPRQFDDADSWHIGKPDLIVTMPKEHTVPADRLRLVGRLRRRHRSDRGSLHQGGGSEAVARRAAASCTTRSTSLVRTTTARIEAAAAATAACSTSTRSARTATCSRRAPAS